MKRWIGWWIIAVSFIHTLFAFVVFGDVLRSLAARGLFDAVGNDARAGVAAWFVLFGALLFVCGITIAALERASSDLLPKRIGWSLLFLAVLGVTLMPASGFWLAFPPALAIIAGRG
jgi:hypothetical protein